MAYCFSTRRGIRRDVRRIALVQLRLAAAILDETRYQPSDQAMHEARRHVKKVRALGRLVQPTAGPGLTPSLRALRAVIRMLAPIADGEAMIATLSRIGARYRRQLPRHAVTALRDALLERQRRIVAAARAEQVLATAATLLRREMEQVERWTLRASGVRAVAPGLERSVRAARRAMKTAAARRTNHRMLIWRHRVKDLWLQVRLLEGRTRGRLLALERHLEALDGILGEHHDCALLAAELGSGALVSREETAVCLRVVRRRRMGLRREAFALGADVLARRPRRAVRDIGHLWTSSAPVLHSPPDSRPARFAPTPGRNSHGARFGSPMRTISVRHRAGMEAAPGLHDRPSRRPPCSRH